MERYAWKATVLPGKLEEYIRPGIIISGRK